MKTKKEKLYFILILLIVLAAVCVLVIGLCRRGRQSGKEPPVPVSAPTYAPQVIYRDVEKFVEVEKTITPEILQDGLNDMGVLITEEYYFTEIVSFSSVKKLLRTDITLNFTESSYLASYDGVITAGIDFNGITVEKDENTKEITVRLPKAEIQNVSIDPNSFQLHSEKTGFANPLSAADFNQSLVELENTARGKALGRGLLERADENARRVIRNFVGGLVDLSIYTLEFEEG